MLKYLLVALATLTLGACATTAGGTAAGDEQPETPIEPPTEQLAGNPSFAIGENENTIVGNPNFSTLLQAEHPQSGDTLVTLHTSMGDIVIRMFPDEAPLAVENFVTHAENGFYDNVIFHRVIEGFMIQGGDPLGTGMGGESIWGGQFDIEFSYNLRHFRGALSMAHTGQPNSIGSQFFIVQNNGIDSSELLEHFDAFLEMQDELLGELDDIPVYMRDLFSPEMIDAYLQYGGTPFLDIPYGLLFGRLGHTVFAQVISGMDIVDAIANVPHDGDPEDGGANRPLEDVTILHTTVTVID
ncbi:MAG: peptidylprolyl isomerase [Turicibacter sp.]|nr:peptidylprolyl isomerase [Turicibacter sp.]